MPPIPLGLKAYRRQANFQPEVEMVNLFIEVDDSGASPDKFARIMRPGLDLMDSIGSGSVRGLYRQQNKFNGDIFRVVGNVLYRGSTSIGAVAGDDLTPFAPGVDALFVLGGNTIYATTGGAASEVPLPDDAEGVPVDIDTLNSYVFVSCSDGTVYWIVPGDLSIDPLNFFTVESSPDGLVAGRRLESEMFFFGQNSTEPWQLTGDGDAPLQKAMGRQYERGAQSRDSVQRIDNSIIWVDDIGRVCRAGALPEVVCDEGISERLRKASGPNSSAFVFGVDRHEFYVLHIPAQGSFAYDVSERAWSRFKSAGMDRWEPAVVLYDTFGSVFGSSLSPKCWRSNPETAMDEGVPVEWTVTGNVAMLGRPQRNDSIAVGVGCASDCTIRLRWHDAREDFPDYYEELEARAPADVVTMYRMGSISPPFRTFELSGNDGVRIRISGAATETWQ